MMYDKAAEASRLWMSAAVEDINIGTEGAMLAMRSGVCGGEARAAPSGNCSSDG